MGGCWPSRCSPADLRRDQEQEQTRFHSLLVWTSLWWLVLSTCAQGGQFQGTITPYGKERCIALNRFSKESGARYLSEDEAKESKLCAIAFDDKGIELCPKTWSTSPGTIV